METKLKVILMGMVIAIAGFAFAFSFPIETYLGYLHKYEFGYILEAYPNLLSGIVIGIGGIAIAVIGNSYFKEKKPKILKKICVNCGQEINANSKHCPNCGFMQ